MQSSGVVMEFQILESSANSLIFDLTVADRLSVYKYYKQDESKDRALWYSADHLNPV